MKLKKTIAAVCFMCLLMLTSCSGENTAESKIAAFELGGVHSSDYPLWSEESFSRHTDSTAPDTLTVEFDGVTYEGSYLYSATDGFNNYMTHYYGSDNADFAVNAESMELETLLLFPDVPYPAGLSAEECKDLAIETAGKFIDTDEYKLTVNSGEYYHGYHFIRCIGGVETCDRLSVGISVTGELATLSLGSVNAFRDIPQPLSGEETIEEKAEALQSRQALEVLDEKISQIYSDRDNVFYEIAGKTLVVTEDDEIGMVFAVDVSAAGSDYSVSNSRLNIMLKESL